MNRESKKNRRQKMLEIIRENNVSTQEELAEKLVEAGYNITQATVSRDIQKLNLIKTKENGKLKYIVLEKIDSSKDRFIDILKNSIIKIDIAENLIIIRTKDGLANASCVAIDDLQLDDIVGTIAGDNTIFVATKTVDAAIVLYNKLELILRKD